PAIAPRPLSLGASAPPEASPSQAGRRARPTGARRRSGGFQGGPRNLTGDHGLPGAASTAVPRPTTHRRRARRPTTHELKTGGEAPPGGGWGLHPQTENRHATRPPSPRTGRAQPGTTTRRARRAPPQPTTHSPPQT